jgi:hypothetical protein
MLPFDKLSNPVGELTVVPMILFNERPASYRGRHLFGERGVRGYGELFGVSLIPKPLLAAIVRGFEGVNNIFQPCAAAQSKGRLVQRWLYLREKGALLRILGRLL